MLELKKIICDISNEYVIPPGQAIWLFHNIAQSLSTSERKEDKDSS